MNRLLLQRCMLCVILFTTFHANIIAQNLRSFNQNSSRSNYTGGLSISFSPVYSTAVNSSNDSLLFRGSGAGFRFGVDYFFGKAAIGFSSGFGSSSPDDAAINNFLKRTAIPPDQLVISKANQQNMYLLLGPSVRFGNKIELSAHAKGGLFVNNSGMVNIQQRGATKNLYKNESTGKSIYPGFLAGLNVQYSTKSDTWSFGFGVDYMNTKSEVINYDARRGGGIEGLKLSRSINDIVAGITVRYNIFSPRDAQSGQSTGKRVLPTVNKREIATARDAGSGMASGKRLLPTVNKREINTTREAGSGMATGKRVGKPKYEDIRFSDGTSNDGHQQDQSCGPVTMTTTNPDGTVEEMTFACPDDAADYSSKMIADGGMPNRISMNVTVPKQTQGATFGEKVNAGLHAAGGAISQGASLSRNIISGRLTWTSSGSNGIITNAIVTNNTTRGGSANLNSQTSSTRTTNQSSFGTMVRFSARERGSGMASGKRTRDAGSGMATGRRQYEPIFIENSGEVCNPCLADVKLSSVKNNPLYKEKGMSGANPLYKGNERTATDADEDCDGIAGIDVYLVDLNNESIVARTRTETCGDFFFANVPGGNYIVKVSGVYAGKKGYDVYMKSKTDLMGSIEQDNEPVQLFLNTEGANDGMTQKAGISTSRSNIRTKSITIIDADLDGDGEFESLKATATFSDGSSQDITSATTTSGTKGIVLEGNALQMDRRRVEVLKSNKQGDPNANRLSSVAIKNTGGRLTATGTFSDGSSRDITGDLAVNTSHMNVRQYSFTIGDSDDDGSADAVIKTKTKSNQSNDRMANGEANDNNVFVNARNKITKSRSNIQNNRMISDEDGDGIWSPRSNTKILRVAAGDVDGDGRADMIVGGAIPGGAVISAAKMQGDPVHGVDVKLGSKSGKLLSTVSANEDGEFEFTNLEAGDYFISVEQNIIINDETFVTVGDDYAAENINTSEDNLEDIAARKGWDGTVKGNSKNIHNSEDNIGKDNQARKGWDGTVKGNSISSGDMGMIAMDANDAVTFRWTPLVPKPKEPVTYKLRVWQLMQGQNGTQAMRSNNPVAEKSVTNTGETAVQGILTGPCKPPYLCDFIWSVQAFNKEGKVIASNNQSGTFSVSPTGTGGAVIKSQDHNSSRSNKTGSIIANDPDNGGNSNSGTKSQDHNSSRSNKSGIIADDPDNGGNSNSDTKSQDHNSSRSNKTGSIIADDTDNEDGMNSKTKNNDVGPVKWMAPESLKTAITTSQDNLESMQSSLDALEQRLDTDQQNTKASINTTRSNIKRHQTAISNLEQTLDELQTKDKDAAMKELEQKRNETDLQFLKLRASLQEMGSQYSSISNVLKSRHDIAMNAIRNMK